MVNHPTFASQFIKERGQQVLGGSFSMDFLGIIALKNLKNRKIS
jgi:hypothetical protein